MFRRIIKYYADRRLLAFFRNQRRIIRLNTLKNSKNIGILWNPSDEGSVEAYESLRKTLKSKGIKPKGVAHVRSSRELEMLTTVTNSGFLHKRNVSWFGRPKSNQIIQFTQEQFDILIDLSIFKTIALQYILVHSSAAFKVGWQGSELNYYDLNIDVSEKPQCQYLLEQIIYYLENINEKG